LDKEKIVDIPEAAYCLERKMDTDQNIDFPTPVEFFLKVPLYKSFKVNESTRKLVYILEHFLEILDAYCIECKKYSTFNCPSTLIRLPGNTGEYNQKSVLYTRIFNISFSCARHKSHTICFYFKIHSGTIQKIGQYPSIAALNITEIGKYRKLLGEERIRNSAGLSVLPVMALALVLLFLFNKNI
jgi:hypothetical protein